MKRLHQPLTLRNDISIEHKFNLKNNQFLIYEEKPPPNWTFVHCEHQWSLHWKPACFMPRAASTCLWKGFCYPVVIICFQWVCRGEKKGKEMLGSLTATQKELPSEGSDSWVSRDQSQGVVISPRFYTYISSRGRPGKSLSLPKDRRLFGGMVGLKGKRNKPAWTRKHP